MKLLTPAIAVPSEYARWSIGDLINEYDINSHTWLASYIIITKGTGNCTAWCVFDTLGGIEPGRSYVLAYAEITRSKTSYWRCDESKN